MLFSRNLFAAFLAVAAVAVGGSPVELEKRNNGNPSFCMLENWSGRDCRTPEPSNVERDQCYNFLTFGMISVGSFCPPPGVTCFLFE